jgi:hypothetical protein
MDWLTLLYTKPHLPLPALCLVSEEFRTGKTTFLKLLSAIFETNAAIIGNNDLTGQFNSYFMTKLLIMIDESFIDMDKQAVKEFIKSLVTAERVKMEAKGVDAVFIDYFGKIIMTSNNERNFMSIDEGQDRFAVIKVPTIAAELYDPLLMEKMIAEVPGLLHTLSTRKIHHELGTETNKEGGRLYFAPHIYATDALRAVQERSKPIVQIMIEEFLDTMFKVSKPKR